MAYLPSFLSYDEEVDNMSCRKRIIEFSKVSQYNSTYSQLEFEPCSHSHEANGHDSEHAGPRGHTHKPPTRLFLNTESTPCVLNLLVPTDNRPYRRFFGSERPRPDGCALLWLTVWVTHTYGCMLSCTTRCYGHQGRAKW